MTTKTEKRIAWAVLVALLVTMGVLSNAYAQVPISGLPAGAALGGTEPIPAVQAAATVRTTPAAIASFANGALTAAQVIGKWGGSCGSTSFLDGSGVCTAVSLTADVSGVLPLANGGTGVSTANDDTVLVSNGTAWVQQLIPNCTDTGGNHLNYTVATNAFSCGTTSSGGGGTPGGSDTTVQYNNAGAFGGDADWTWNATTNLMTVGSLATAATIAAPTTGSVALTIRAGTGSGAAGGIMTVQGGAGATGFSGGALNLRGGGGGGTSGNGAPASLIGGAGGAPNGNGAVVNITGGAGVGSGNSGGVIIDAGTPGGSSTASPISILGGNAGSGAGGNIIATAGNAAVSGAGGAITVTSGNGVGTNQNAGTVTIAAGTRTGTGTSTVALVTNGATRLTIDAAGNLATPTNATRITNNGVYISAGGAPVVAGGCSPSSPGGGRTAGFFSAGVTGVCAVQITFPVTATGWVCSASNMNTGTVFPQTTSTSTTCDIGANATIGDIITFMAVGY